MLIDSQQIYHTAGTMISENILRFLIVKLAK